MQVQGRWIPATVVSMAGTPHSYIVKTASGKTYRRNRRHLMKCLQEDESSLDDYVPPEPAEQPAQEAERNDLELDDDLNEPLQQETYGTSRNRRGRQP